MNEKMAQEIAAAAARVCDANGESAIATLLLAGGEPAEARRVASWATAHRRHGLAWLAEAVARAGSGDVPGAATAVWSAVWSVDPDAARAAADRIRAI